jgi:sugar O-acyltransferase (sialic acid O-acetyltransferase NeuD family)
MTQVLYGIFGASGYGREVMPIAREQATQHGLPPNRLVFIDDKPMAESVNGHLLMTYDKFLHLEATERFVAIAIADGHTRAKLADRCAQDRITPWTIKAANAIILDSVAIGPGAILSPFVTLTSNIRIGKYFHANIYSYVAHDCIIGDFVTFAPHVQCNGNAVVEDHAYIGTGAILRQGKKDSPLRIGRGAIVGMGAVITKDVAPGTTVVGNPARPLVRS